MLVEIYTKEDCPYCQLAKTALASKNIQFTEQLLYRDFTRDFIVEKFPTAKSFPIIVLDGFYIGGYTQLKEHLDNQDKSSQIVLNE